MAAGLSEGQVRLKVALLPSFTINALSEVLLVKCYEAGLVPEVYVANYNQYAQELVNPESGLHKFKADISILLLDLQALMGDHFFNPYEISDVERRAWVEQTLREIVELSDRYKASSQGRLLIHNLEVPSYSPMGVLEGKQSYGICEAIEDLNSRLRLHFKTDERIFIFDYNTFCSKHGKRNIVDHKMYYLGDIRLSMNLFPELCEEYLGYLKPLCSKIKKCIVVDLDNTLWGGVVGEDGLNNIKLGPTAHGRPFFEFQKHLLALHNRGFILAINSKNNEKDALEVFQKHPSMVLKEKHFSATRINWEDKIANLKAIAKELNIGLESMVFIDDDKLNCEMVRDALPEVKVVALPNDSALYVSALKALNDFNMLQLTAEDLNKGKLYSDQKNREKLKEAATDITSYLRSLEMTLTFEPANDFNIPRLAQLTQKTNQFNMTTKRYQEEDIRRFAASKDHFLVSVRVVDKFGDSGIVGLIMGEKAPAQWKIDSFLLSCRVLGRKIEDAIIAYIAEQARQERAQTLIGVFVATAKNDPAKGFFEAARFSFLEKTDNAEKWALGLTSAYPFPDFIKITKGD